MWWVSVNDRLSTIMPHNMNVQVALVDDTRRESTSGPPRSFQRKTTICFVCAGPMGDCADGVGGFSVPWFVGWRMTERWLWPRGMCSPNRSWPACGPPWMSPAIGPCAYPPLTADSRTLSAVAPPVTWRDALFRAGRVRKLSAIAGRGFGWARPAPRPRSRVSRQRQGGLADPHVHDLITEGHAPEIVVFSLETTGRP